MSDDLVKRLREDQPVTQDMGSTMQCALQDAAANRIEKLEAKLAKAVEERDEALNQLDSARHSVDVLEKRVKTFCDGWGVADKGRIEAETKLAEAVDALGEAIYLLDPDEEDIAKETGLHRIVTTYAELTGGMDE
jgi:chromosome segregation ATPase